LQHCFLYLHSTLVPTCGSLLQHAYIRCMSTMWLMSHVRHIWYSPTMWDVMIHIEIKWKKNTKNHNNCYYELMASEYIFDSFCWFYIGAYMLEYWGLYDFGPTLPMWILWHLSPLIWSPESGTTCSYLKELICVVMKWADYLWGC
jgi:hypothetical protein